MAQADGTITIDAKVDPNGIIAGRRDIEKALKSIMSTLNEIADMLRSFPAKISAPFETAEKQIENTTKKARKAKKEIENLKIDSWESAESSDYDGPLRDPVEYDYVGAAEKSKEIKKCIEDYAGSLSGATKKQKNLLELIKETKQELAQMESKGIGPGDKEYDNAQKSLITLSESLKSYTRNLVYETQEEISELGSLEGRIAQVKQKIEQLKNVGTGIERPEMQEQLGILAELEEKYKNLYTEVTKTESMRQKEARAVAAQQEKAEAATRREEARIAAMNRKLEETRAKEVQAAVEANRLKAIGDNAEVSNRDVVRLNKELSELRTRQEDLQKAGIGLGYEEFDKNAARINKINQKLKQYESSITGARKKTGNFSGVIKTLKKSFARIANAVKRVSNALFSFTRNAGSAKKAANGLNLGLGKVIKTTLLYGTVSRALSSITSGIGEGINHLVQYSGSVNASLSSMYSALIQLKNAFATAFAPILSVVSPILTQFINMISKAVTYVGMFFAALTGQQTFAKAVGVQQDYAASLGNTADKTKDVADSTKDAAKAQNDYLSGLDEINRYTTNKNDNGSDSGIFNPSTGGELTPSDMFETVPIENTIKGLVDKIKKLIKNEDWEGFGKYVAKGINKGLKKIYDAINWKKVGPKITKFTKAFTETFNSLVDNIDWDLLGRTIGTGINTVVNTLNQLIGKDGIDFRNIGTKISVGLRGAINEINWTNLGNLLGNKFMISWKILNGFVTDMSRKNDAGLTGWAELGVSIGEAANGIFEKIDFVEIADVLTGGINGAFEALDNFTDTFEWDDLVENIQSGITEFLSTMEWEKNGQALGNFISHMCDAIKRVMTKDNFYELGNGIADFIGELPWGEILKTTGEIILNALAGLLGGIWSNDNIGILEKGISTAFLTIKISKITGIGTIAGKIISHLITKLSEKQHIEKMTEAFKGIFGTSASDAADAATEELGKIDGALDNTGGKASLTSTLLSGLKSILMGNGPITAEAGFAVMLGHVNETMETTKNLKDDTVQSYGTVTQALKDLADQGIITNAQLLDMLPSFDTVKTGAFNFDEQFQKVISSLENAGISSDTFKTALRNAMENSSVASNEYSQKISDYLGVAESSIGNLSNKAQEDFPAIDKAVSDASGNIETTTGTTWGNSEGSVVANINSMKSASSKGMKQIFKNVESYTKSIWNVMSNTWDSLAKKVSTALDGVSDVIISQMNSVIRTVNNAISNINYSISGIESAFNFGPWDVPTPTGSRIIGFSATFPRVPDIPYLATGAVIPPRSEFLAVLGDQKHGNNIEAPEPLLRKIVREESGGRTGGTYQFVGQINRRVLFEEFMAEAQLVRSQSGRNPFEMA